MKKYYQKIFCPLVLSLFCLVSGGIQAEERIALVIGNGDYQDAPLNTPVNDAKLMRESLEKTGFQVIYKVNANQAALE